MSSTDPRIAIVGAPGLVGRAVLSVLEGRSCCPATPLLLAATGGDERRLEFRGQQVSVHPYSPERIDGADVVLLCAGARFAGDHARDLAASGPWVVDTSSRWRREADVPLIVPPVNGAELTALVRKAESEFGHDAGAEAGAGRGALRFSNRLVAGPNCTAAIASVALAPLCGLGRLRRLSLSSYQSASGGGRALLEELDSPHSAESLSGLKDNVLPRIGDLDELGESGEETKICAELERLLSLRGTAVSATAVRVPTRVGHGMALSLWLDPPPEVEDATAALESSPAVELWPSGQGEPTPRHAAGRDPVLVGRVRRPAGDAGALCLWVVGDNLLRGAALNAVEILELILGEGPS